MARKLVLLFCLLLVLAAGGAVYWRFAAPPAEAAVQLPRPPAHGAFVTLEPITLPVLRDGDVRKLVTFVVAVELAPGLIAPDLSPLLPRLRDGYLTELAYLLSLDWPGGAIIDLPTARRRLAVRGARAGADGTVVAVLFTAVYERSI